MCGHNQLLFVEKPFYYQCCFELVKLPFLGASLLKPRIDFHGVPSHLNPSVVSKCLFEQNSQRCGGILVLRLLLNSLQHSSYFLELSMSNDHVTVIRCIHSSWYHLEMFCIFSKIVETWTLSHFVSFRFAFDFQFWFLNNLLRKTILYAHTFLLSLR